jgi:hypothetical protein
MRVDFELFPIGTKIECLDKDGQMVGQACGIIIKHLGDGQAIILSQFDGLHYSTVGINNVVENECWSEVCLSCYGSGKSPGLASLPSPCKNCQGVGEIRYEK